MPKSRTTIDVLSLNDGKISIEFQLDLFVTDLFGIKDNEDISLGEVLAGIRYVMDNRLRGGRQPSMDANIMERLCKGLLMNMGHTEGMFLRKKPTDESDEAFILFGEFMEEVEEFRLAVSKIPTIDLRYSLKIHLRCQPYCTERQKQAAVAMIKILTTYFPHLSDWRDLVKESEQEDMEKLLEVAEKVPDDHPLKQIKMPPSTSIPLPPPALYFDRPIPKLLRMFYNVDPTIGLSASDNVPILLAHYGPNKLPDPPKPSIFKMLLTQITDFMVLILLAATIVTAAEQEFNSMGVLLVVIVLNTIIGFTQEYKASKALEALTRLSVPKAQVIRDGTQQMIDSAELVPGDIVILEEGDSVPADMRLIEVSQLEIIESILTGESVPVSKNVDAIKVRTRKLPLGDCKGNAFMSTVVAKGRGKGLVVRTGIQTEIGKISTALNNSSQQRAKTPIQRKLARLGKYLVALAILLCALVVVIGVVWKHSVKDMINVGLSLAVSVIPEGLVAVVTVTMAIGVKRMAARNAIVRTLPAVETLGSVTVICSDKTGTLTEGKMGASELWTSDNALFKFTESTSLNPEKGEVVQQILEHKEIPVKRTPTESTLVSGTSPSTDLQLTSTQLSDKNTYHDVSLFPVPRDPSKLPKHLLLSMMVASLCNNSSVEPDPDSLDGFKPLGDPTEVAMVVAAHKVGVSKHWWVQEQGFVKVVERAFDSERKLMSVVYRCERQRQFNMEDKEYEFVLAKGAPEELLRKCTTFYSGQDQIDLGNAIMNTEPAAFLLSPEFITLPLTDSFIEAVTNESSRMASSGLRVLGLGMKRIPKHNLSEKLTPEQLLEQNVNYAESGLVFVGLIGLIDPPRAGVKEAVEQCQKAGISVFMITGDHVATASAIAMQLGIMKKGVVGLSRAIKGAELDLLSDDALMELNPFPNVFARVSPENKLKIVKILQKKGELVAMTGDGVNDAPAIKASDVGVAMGISGTEITKQAADIVLANDNFTTIVAAVEEGRRVFDNILKFIVYLLSCNGAEIFLMLISAAANLPLPFTTIMILWANIIADIPPAMAIGVEPAEKDLMLRHPRNPNAGVLTIITWTMVGLQGLIMAGVTLAVFTIALYVENIPLADARSLAFATLTTVQLLHAFLSKTINQSLLTTGLLGNWTMIWCVLGSFVAMLIGIYVPGISNWLELTWVTWFGWIKILICCIFWITLIEIEKLVIRKINKRP